MTELQTKYKNEIVQKLIEKFGYKNSMEVPTLEKIIVNAGIGSEYRKDTKVVEEMVEAIGQITGQRPVVVNAKIAVSNFKLREGMPNGIMVTLRKDMMWDFFYKLVNIALPRVKDFRGVPRNSFDSKGNYTLGIKEHTIFPEIDTTKLQKIRSLQVVVVTTADNKEEARELLNLLGMPFKKSNIK